MARSIPVPIPQPMSATQHRQQCHDIIRSHWPIRTWRHWWRRRCVTCDNPWTEQVNDSGNAIVGCRPVRGAVAELAGLLEDRRPAARRRARSMPANTVPIRTSARRWSR